MSGQTLTDRIAAAQYQLTGSDMARAVCKATTHEVMAPKKKHLECKSSFLCPILHGLTFSGPIGLQAANTSTQNTCHHSHKSYLIIMAQSFLNSLSS